MEINYLTLSRTVDTKTKQNCIMFMNLLFKFKSIFSAWCNICIMRRFILCSSTDYYPCRIGGIHYVTDTKPADIK